MTSDDFDTFIQKTIRDMAGDYSELHRCLVESPLNTSTNGFSLMPDTGKGTKAECAEYRLKTELCVQYRLILHNLNQALKAMDDGDLHRAMRLMFAVGKWHGSAQVWIKSGEQIAKMGNLMELKAQRARRKSDAPDEFKSWIIDEAKRLHTLDSKKWTVPECARHLHRLYMVDKLPVIFKRDRPFTLGTFESWIRKTIS